MVHFGDASARRSVAHFNNVADLQPVAGNIDDLAVYQNVTMRDHLPCLEDALGISEPIDGGLQPELKKSKEIESRVAMHVAGLLERVSELALEHRIVEADDLLGQQLLAVFRSSALPHIRPMLTGRVGPLGARTLSFSPNIEADFAANVCFSSSISRHRNSRGKFDA